MADDAPWTECRRLVFRELERAHEAVAEHRAETRAEALAMKKELADQSKAIVQLQMKAALAGAIVAIVISVAVKFMN